MPEARVHPRQVVGIGLELLQAEEQSPVDARHDRGYPRADDGREHEQRDSPVQEEHRQRYGNQVDEQAVHVHRVEIIGREGSRGHLGGQAEAHQAVHLAGEPGQVFPYPVERGKEQDDARVGGVRHLEADRVQQVRVHEQREEGRGGHRVQRAVVLPECPPDEQDAQYRGRPAGRGRQSREADGQPQQGDKSQPAPGVPDAHRVEEGGEQQVQGPHVQSRYGEQVYRPRPLEQSFRVGVQVFPVTQAQGFQQRCRERIRDHGPEFPDQAFPHLQAEGAEILPVARDFRRARVGSRVDALVAQVAVVIEIVEMLLAGQREHPCPARDGVSRSDARVLFYLQQKSVISFTDEVFVRRGEKGFASSPENRFPAAFSRGQSRGRGQVHSREGDERSRGGQEHGRAAFPPPGVEQQGPAEGRQEIYRHSRPSFRQVVGTRDARCQGREKENVRIPVQETRGHTPCFSVPAVGGSPRVLPLLGQDEPVVNLELPRADVVQLPFQQALLQGAEVIREQHPLQVVVLVLDDAGRCSLELLRVLHPVLVPVRDFYFILADDIFVYARDAEATLVERHVLSRAFQDMGVDERLLESGAGRVNLCECRAVHHEYPDILPHLRGGQSDPVRLVHRLPQVIDKLLQSLVLRGNVLGNLAQHGMPVNVNW